MNTILRITLLVSFLMLFVSKTEAVVQNHAEKATTKVATAQPTIQEKSTFFNKKRFKKKFQKQLKSLKANWKIAKDKKKRFGKIGSITAFVLLSTAAFTVLKLTNVIAWSWFWVLSPLIFYVGLILLVVIIALFVVLALKKAGE